MDPLFKVGDIVKVNSSIGVVTIVAFDRPDALHYYTVFQRDHFAGWIHHSHIEPVPEEEAALYVLGSNLT